MLTFLYFCYGGTSPIKLFINFSFTIITHTHTQCRIVSDILKYLDVMLVLLERDRRGGGRSRPPDQNFRSSVWGSSSTSWRGLNAPPPANRTLAMKAGHCKLLRSSSSHQLLVPAFRLTTVGRRTFPVAASLLCTSLPADIQSSPSLPVFRQRLITFPFRQSFPNIVL